ncbi:hypothetical protein NDU88_002616 [Pleurodeles waltl]|uniref:Uncharacterized protein n=1 Tax=Pleurodeles waltl TaxID=8319 RepID=A0AAV7MW97_PLEWA|nr:hypothetical protein NDU88_002616 [Pleurodeles waltl]
MLNVRFLVNVTEAEHHDASVSKETETLARSSREVLRTLRNTVRFWVVQRIWYIKVSPYKGEGKKSMIGTKWFVGDEVSNDMSSQCEVPVRHANETQVVGGNGVSMRSDERELKPARSSPKLEYELSLQAWEKVYRIQAVALKQEADDAEDAMDDKGDEVDAA